ncbi:MAG: prephenate/arogenate dehydrogenase [Chroococcales cyanobacterium]
MKIGIIGLGLIGGSLALEWRSQGHQVLGVSRSDITCQKAIERGIVDDASVRLTLLAAADIVFICTPMAAIAATVKQLIPHLKPETIITDVGSVKTPIVEACSQLWPNFLGGHPMAGTQYQGIDAVEKGLFEGRPYVLTPTETTSPAVTKQTEALVRSLNPQVYICRPETHDQAVAWISHLPVMVSAGLIEACLQEKNPDVLKLAKALASSGFRDTSRVGGGNPELGTMMAQYNRNQLLKTLSQYRQTLDQLIEVIQQEDWQKLQQHLEQTHNARKDFM